MKEIPLIVFSVFLNATAQLLLKAGMQRIGAFHFSWSNFTPILMQVLSSPFVLGGLLVYVVAVAVWLLVLSRVDVGIAYPMISMAYIITAVAACYLFGENLSAIRITGIGIILVGVYLVSKT